MALAYFHKAKHSEAQAEYGHIITFITRASTLAQEAVKLSKNFASNIDYFLSFTQSLSSPILSALSGSPTSPKSPTGYALTEGNATVFEETCKSLASVLSEALKSANKDNDMIYHAIIPPFDSLPALDKVSVAKAIDIIDFLPNGRMDVAKIVGPDIFGKLVPMEITQKASLYSDEKDSLVRRIKQIVQGVESEQNAKLYSISFQQTLSKVKSGPKRVSEALDCPSSLLESISAVQMEESGQSGLKQMAESVEVKRSDTLKIIGEIGLFLDQDARDCEGKRV